MCFSAEWLGHLLVQIVIICAIVGIIRLLLPYVLNQLGVAGGVIASAINIILWAVIAIFVIWFCIDLLECLGTGLLLPGYRPSG